MKKKSDETVWDAFLKQAEVVGYSSDIIEYIAVFEILRRSVCGQSNSDISRILKLPPYYVFSTLQEFLKFGGWDQELFISPMAYYVRSNGNEQNFIQEISQLGFPSKDYVKTMFQICKKFEQIKKDVDKFYELC